MPKNIFNIYILILMTASWGVVYKAYQQYRFSDKKLKNRDGNLSQSSSSENYNDLVEMRDKRRSIFIGAVLLCSYITFSVLRSIL